MSQPDLLYGYRVWKVDEEGRLYSVRGPVTLPWAAWPVDRPMTATCVRGFFPWGQHRAPVFGCSCGVYACKEPVELGPSASGVDPYGPHVMGVIQLWGRVVEHPLGWRAEKGKPIAIEWSDAAERVAARYKAVLLGSLKEWAA